MRVFFVVTSLGMGGAENIVVNLADKYVENGHEVVIAYAFGDPIVLPKNKSIKILPLEVSHYTDFFSAYLKLRKFIHKFNPDVVHSHMVHANILSRLVRITTKMPRLICTAHSTNEGGRLRMLAYRLTDRLADLSTNVSKEAVDAFVKIGAVSKDRMIPVLNGIDTEKFVFNLDKRIYYRNKFKVKEDDKVIIAVGSLNTCKDYPNLLNAIALVINKKANVQLKVVGDGPLKNELQQLTNTLGIENNVDFIGMSHDIPGLMSASDLFVLSSSFEGFGLVVAEAMACERLIVATNSGGVSEVVGHHGLLVQPQNFAVLAESILIQLAKTVEESKVEGKYSRQYISKHYSLDCMANNYINLYKGDNVKL